MRRIDSNSESGAVIVIVALWLPVLALFLAFAADFGNFFDYSRNLQNRADAAALAAGDAYGGTCFGVDAKGQPTYTSTQTDAIGQTAQQYSGPPPGTPPSNLPYGYTLPLAFQPYQNPPNLTTGTPDNYHVLLNSTANWGEGGTNWSMESANARTTDPNPGGTSSLALCSSTDEDSNSGPMVDVRVTQDKLGLLFGSSLFNLFSPSISAHARVTLEGIGAENNVLPLAIRDPASERCVEANFINASTGNQIGSSVALQKIGTDPNTGAVQWDNAKAPASVGIPSGANVYVQIVTGFCDQNPATYDPTGGLLYINSWSTASPASGTKPVISTGGVYLSGNCNSDRLSNYYFTDQACAVGLTAHIAFAPGAGTKKVDATDSKGNTIHLQNSPAGSNTWVTPVNQSFPIDPGTGQHAFKITTTQGTGNPCGGKGSTVGVCDLGVQTQAFGACDDGDSTLTCNDPNDSGPIVLAQLRLAGDSAGLWASDVKQAYGESTFAGGGPNQQMIVTVEIAGLSNAKPGDLPTILRFTENAANTDHATGLIDCGQGQNKPGAIDSLINGCPVVGSSACPFDTRCAPLAINHRPLSSLTPCAPEGNDLSGTVVARTPTNATVPVDCTGTAAGNMPPVVTGLACRIILAGCKLNNGKPNGSVCAANNWSPTKGASSILGGDPRAVTLVITAPSDLAKNNSGQIIPIENFAVFYITGWTTQGGNPSCGSYAAAPSGTAADAEHLNNCPDGSVPANGNCTGVSKGMVWGYWMKYTDVNAIPTGTVCNVSAFGDCTPALTR